jgi:hypothetical protein
MRCTIDTAHESIHLATCDNASTSLEQVHVTPPQRDDTNDFTLKGEQISSLGCNEVRDARRKFRVATQQFLEICRGKC